MTELHRSEHIDEIGLAAYVDGSLTGDARRAAEVHLADCDSCRREVVAVRELVVSRIPRGLGSPKAWRWGAATAAAAAAVAFVVFVPLARESAPANGGPLPSGSELRTDAAESRVEVLRPPEGDVSTEDLRFEWTPVGRDAVYELSLRDSEGAPVWSTRTGDTSIVLPEETAAGLVTGERYFWRIDALLPDLTTANSGERTFTVR